MTSGESTNQMTVTDTIRAELVPARTDLMRIAPEKTNWLDRQIENVSELFSSILVKESRQALKSRQFLWTFFLMLIVVATWTLFALSYLYSEMAGNDIASGPFLLAGYWMILGFPLAIIIPYSAYRSLAQEFEDGTLQMVSITTLRPYQIICGKLGSAMLQMMTYMSVIAPCIVFTYMLRGVDLFQVMLGFSIATVGCMSLCILGLFLAGAARTKVLGLIVSLLLVMGLLFAYYLWCIYSWASTYFGSSMTGMMTDPQAQLGVWASFGSAITTAAILFVASCSQIAFKAENRSTAIRIALLVQQTFFIGLGISILGSDAGPPDQAYWVFAMFYAHYWVFIGGLIVSVPTEVSRRVRRSFPTSGIGLAFYSLLLPGRGRGYLFVVANLLACMVSFILVAFISNSLGFLFSNASGVGNFTKVASSVGAATLYAIFFVTIVYLLMGPIFRQRPQSPVLLGGLLAVFFVIFSSLISVILENYLAPGAYSYTMIQTFNWYTTVDEIFDGRSFAATMSIGIVGMLTTLLVVLAVRRASRDLVIRELAVPDRVLEDIEANRRQAPPPGETIDDIFAAPRPEA